MRAFLQLVSASLNPIPIILGGATHDVSTVTTKNNNNKENNAK